jgi:excisionase family DNA binding protein
MNKGSWNGSLDIASTVFRLTYSVKEMAFSLGISVPTAWRMVYDRQIPAVKVRGRVMIRVRDIENYLNTHQLENFKDA